MAHKDDKVLFTIQCGKCGQHLTPQIMPSDGTYSHDNNDDCDAGDVVMPVVTPEQVAALFEPKHKLSTRAKKSAKK